MSCWVSSFLFHILLLLCLLLLFIYCFHLLLSRQSSPASPFIAILSEKKIFIYHGIIWYTFWPFILLLFKNLSFLFHTINFYPSFSTSFLRLRMTNTAAVYRSNPLKLNYKYLPSFGDDISGLKFCSIYAFQGSKLWILGTCNVWKLYNS